MFKKRKLLLALTSILLVMTLVLVGFAEPVATAQAEGQTTSVPKYVFLFIGDGMSFPQVTALGYFNGTVENDFVGTLADPTLDNIPDASMPSFTDFEVIGAATTYDASKFVTDSASAATAIACSVKTLDGALGVDVYGNSATSIAEILRDNGYKIGIVSTVSLDHATPAGFYAHVPNRNSFYEIGLQLIASEYDFFGGGGFKQPTGADGDQTDLIELAIEAGYNFVNTYEEIEALDSSAGKTIAINPVLDNISDAAMNYAIDRAEDDFGLADYVRKAIDVLDNDTGFFIMAEGGKIDWACHANDAYTAILETSDLDYAVQVAVEFANEHPDETLILVTGDHETGGFTMGNNGTQYNTYLSILQNQQLSFKNFADNYVVQYCENNTPFETAMQDVKELFGLMLPDDPDAEAAESQFLVLTEREVAQLQEAYSISMIPYSERDRDADYKTTYTIYEHEPFQIVITHILNNRAGLGWTSTAHTGLPAAVYAMGAGSDEFGNFYDNTEISQKILAVMEISK